MDADSIRLKLKEFEYSFAKEHSRKPDRNDIKANLEISTLYKRYEKLRKSKSKSRPPALPKSPQTPSRKKVTRITPFIVESPSPRKLSTPTKTPQIKFDDPQKLEQILQTMTPSRSPFLETTPLKGSPFINSVGPTPQVNGRALGLFDGLSPLKRKNMFGDPNTPSKVQKMIPCQTPCKTPTRSPIPSSPAIFRIYRASESPLKLFQKPRGKGFSTLIAEIRQLEDEAEDEGEGVLRELEQGNLTAIEPHEEDGGNKQGVDGIDKTFAPQWRKKATQKTKRRAKRELILLYQIDSTVRPVPAASSTAKIGKSVVKEDVERQQDKEMQPPSDLEAVSDDQEKPKYVLDTVKQKKAVRKAKVKGGLNLTAQVSKNFRSLKLRNRGAKNGGRFGRRR
ncbi:DNA replication regulator SLD2 [Neolecta irregularis DAH-3]|uniref:DNA replication regulator SLD2 n=1 Tax=Neolecta irregularis (strain DAH-3) TaxID=1198029 RepID=A0A1U7LTF5_NEOID|nr:DNA replication regulator SLD2 [Neolecta irregularis DAH-3]|eukprot:OLL25950.1 DNA replication regulator SLD2 [Neolecta irregularis DAH-3]